MTCYLERRVNKGIEWTLDEEERYSSSAYLNAKETHSQLWVFQVHLKQNASGAKEWAILLSANTKPSNSHSFSEDLTLLMLSNVKSSVWRSSCEWSYWLSKFCKTTELQWYRTWEMLQVHHERKSWPLNFWAAQVVIIYFSDKVRDVFSICNLHYRYVFFSPQ